MTVTLLSPGAVAAAVNLLTNEQTEELDKLLQGIEDPVAYTAAMTRYLRWKFGDEKLDRIARRSSLFPDA
jgi:hypothetical protein